MLLSHGGGEAKLAVGIGSDPRAGSQDLHPLLKLPAGCEEGKACTRVWFHSPRTRAVGPKSPSYFPFSASRPAESGAWLLALVGVESRPHCGLFHPLPLSWPRGWEGAWLPVLGVEPSPSAGFFSPTSASPRLRMGYGFWLPALTGQIKAPSSALLHPSPVNLPEG